MFLLVLLVGFFYLDLVLYLYSGQNDLVHRYEFSVLSNDKCTVINLCRIMTVTYYHTPILRLLV